jgi:hypothetical protein
MLKKLVLVGCAVGAVTACSPPAAAPSTSVAAAVPAPPPAVSTQATTSGASAAKTCSIDGLRWRKWDTQINPKMVVSNDGFCGSSVHVNSNVAPVMQLSAKPDHGRIDTFGEGTANAGFRYYPEQGYVGPDSFVMVTGDARHEVVANFSVTVSD